jgi:hypothetical protein
MRTSTSHESWHDGTMEGLSAYLELIAGVAATRVGFGAAGAPPARDSEPMAIEDGGMRKLDTVTPSLDANRDGSGRPTPPATGPPNVELIPAVAGIDDPCAAGAIRRFSRATGRYSVAAHR